MRLNHLAATLLLAAMYGCAASATVVATTGATARPAASTQPVPAASAAPSIKPSPATSAAPSPAPTASAIPVTPRSPSADCLAAFDRYNVDKDTFLSFDEYVAGRWGDIRFGRAPTAQEEADHKADLRAEATQADADKDGKLSRSEFAATCT